MASDSRSEARERALSLLYEAEMKGVSPADLLADLPLDPPPFVATLVEGVGRSQARLDELIQQFAIDWEVDRMPAIDRNVLRLALFELLERPDTPVGAVISEAVELAKRYSTEESGRFVNGILSNLATHVRG